MRVDFIARFDREYAPKLGIRAPTFRAIIRESIAKGAVNVVETGCARKKDNWLGDGQSTIIWNDYCDCSGGGLITIDISREAIDFVRETCPQIGAICGDSIAALQRLKAPIDMLYLDSYDLDMTAPHDAALHCMMEFCAAQPHLRGGSIVAVDDSPVDTLGNIGGKGMYVAQYFKKFDILPFTVGYQAAWLVP